MYLSTKYVLLEDGRVCTGHRVFVIKLWFNSLSSVPLNSLLLPDSLMKASHKMVSRCMYLNILLHTKSHDILNRLVRLFLGYP